MIIDEYATFLMDKHYEFRNKIAYDMGLRPVFKIIDMHREAGYIYTEITADINGKEIPATEVKIIEPPEGLPACPDNKEIEDYLREESKWIAVEALKKFGWNAFVKECIYNDIDDFFVKEHTPCEGPDGQCGFECSRYEKCVMRRPAKLVFEK